MSLLVADNIKKYFPVKEGLGMRREWLKAVDGVSFSIEKNSVFSLVGESGCGKSTVAKLLLRLIPLTDGKILFKGEDISKAEGEQLKKFRRSVQIIFQDPFASLNPRMRIIEILSEPFIIHKVIPKKEIKNKVEQLISKVGLTPDALYKYPHEFSGGQRQRICIARALSLSPDLIVADEPLSALDVSIQAQIINMLKDIKKETEVAIFFISHDLRVVRYLSDTIAVMYLGKIVELADTDELFEKPKHPYTSLLLSSIPKIKFRGNFDKGSITFKSQGDDLSIPINISPGCPFYPRCSKRLSICDKEMPQLRRYNNSLVACHLFSES
jgi:oligopeptide/dipeptide ABC transporter ATP-binding protein